MTQLALKLPHDAALGADDFLITASNREAAALIGQWPAWPAPGVIVAGASGSGKTHLLHLWLEQSGARLLTLADFTKTVPDFLAVQHAHYAVDNADALAGQAEAEENLFHLFNHVKSGQGSLLLTLRRGAGQADFVLPDLRSRLLTLPTVFLAPPDDTLLAALIVKQFRDRQITLDAGVVSYLTTHATRDAGQVRDLIDRLDHAALAQGRKVSVALARKVMEEAHA